MQNPIFTPGQDYTRDQIHQQLGGGLVTYLPHRKGKVVCACLTPALNPKAPNVILVGRGAGIERAGEWLSGQTGPIPVFLKRTSKQWTYHGMWKVCLSSQLPQDIERESGTARRGNVTRVIFMDAVKASAAGVSNARI